MSAPRPKLLVPSILFASALAVRGVAATRVAVIFDDGPRFIGLAQQMSQGRFAEALGDDQHPLYPFLVMLAQRIVPGGDWEVAAVAVSMLAGAVAVVALHDFVRRAFGEREALVAGALATVSPFLVRFSSDVQSDGLYGAFFLAAVAALWRVIERPRPAGAIAAGSLAGLAYLTRPEGIGLLCVAFVALVLAATRARVPRRTALAALAALLAAAALFSLPYLGVVGGGEEGARITAKKSLARIAAGALGSGAETTGSEASLGPPPPLRPFVSGRRSERQAQRRAAWGAPLWSAYELSVASVGALRFEVVVPLLLGLWISRGRVSRRGALIATIVALYLVVAYGLGVGYGYISRRHVIYPLALLLGYASLGTLQIGDWLARALRRLGVARAHGSAWAVGLGVFLVGGAALPLTFIAQRGDELHVRVAAEWLREQPGMRGPVAATRARVAYYAGEDWIDLRRIGDWNDLRASGARYVIVKSLERRELGVIADVSAGQLVPLHSEGTGDAAATVHELAPSPGPGGE